MYGLMDWIKNQIKSKQAGLEGSYDQWKIEFVNTNTSKYVNKCSLTTITMLSKHIQKHNVCILQTVVCLIWSNIYCNIFTCPFTRKRHKLKFITLNIKNISVPKGKWNKNTQCRNTTVVILLSPVFLCMLTFLYLLVAIFCKVLEHE